MNWIDGVRGTDSIREVARRAGLNQATLNRQVNLDAIGYDVVRDIARAYSRPVLSALVATGHLSPEDVGLGDVEAALSAATDEQLVLEVARRLDIPAASMLFDQPLSSATERAANNVSTFPTRNVGSSAEDQDLPAAARQREREETDEQ